MECPLKNAEMGAAGYTIPFFEQNGMKVWQQNAKNKENSSNCPTKGGWMSIGTPIADSWQRHSPTWFYTPLAHQS